MEKSGRHFPSLFLKWRTLFIGEKEPLYLSLFPTKITPDSPHIHSQSFKVTSLQRSARHGTLIAASSAEMEAG